MSLAKRGGSLFPISALFLQTRAPHSPNYSSQRLPYIIMHKSKRQLYQVTCAYRMRSAVGDLGH